MLTRLLRLLRVRRQHRGPSPILPMDPREQQLLDRQRAARGIADRRGRS